MKENRGRAGSVSIYFIAATAGFVLLTGLLIDFARIAAFRKQAELAVKSGARSVLSAYDPDLYGGYGLFARGGDPADELMRLALGGNLEPETDGSFRLVDARWEESGVMESRPLADHGVYRRQVLEEMKYKAPIDLTLELASRFRGIAPALREAQSSVDVLERMRQAYDKREAALDRALEAQKKAGGKLSESLDGSVPRPSVSLAGSKSAGRASHIADAALMYADYVRKRQSDEERAEAHSRAMAAYDERKRRAEESGQPFAEEPPSGGEPQYSSIVSAYERSVKELARSLAEKPPRGLSEANEALEKAREAVAEANEANAEMKRIADEAETFANEPGGREEIDPDAAIGDDKAASMADLRQSVRELVLEEAFFSAYREELEEQANEGERVAEAAADLSVILRSAPGSSGMDGELRSAAGSVQSLGNEYRSRYGDSGSIVGRRQELLEEHRSADSQRKQLEREARREWQGAAAFLRGFAGGSAGEEDVKSFDRLRKLTEANLEWNEAEEERREEIGRAASPEEARDDSMNASGGWMDALGDAAAGSRDALYYAEYAASRFTHTDPSEVRDMLNGGGEGITKADRQELEYVLYGLNNPSGNIAAAYGEIFAMRLAIRTMEGLIECRTYGHPLAVLAAALVYAIQHALADMNELLNTGKMPLSRYARVDTYYLDYLRVFLLLHGDSASRTARSIAVTEAATGLSFERTYTYVSGEATASLRLWFFPGLTRLLERAGSWGGVVRDGRYEVTYKAEDSYQ